MASKKQRENTGAQSARFIEAAEKAGADATGKKFERAFKKVVRPKKAAKTRPR